MDAPLPWLSAEAGCDWRGEGPVLADDSQL